jgi:hypothetical protein
MDFGKKHTYTCKKHIQETHACMHTYIGTCIKMHTYIHRYMHTYIGTCIHTYVHAYIHRYMHTYIGTYIGTCIQKNNFFLTQTMQVNDIQLHNNPSYKCQFQFLKLKSLAPKTKIEMATKMRLHSFYPTADQSTYVRITLTLYYVRLG